MATKDEYLASSNNKKNGINSINHQYQSLNLNQGGHYFVGNTVSSRSGINDSKKVQTKNYGAEIQRKECSLWKKQDFNSRSLHNNFDQQEIEKEKRNCLNIGTSSTLSLHIKAYENTNISDSSNTTLKNADLIKKCKDAKKIFENTTILNGFELPRQQENDPPTPEVMQFKSSKKMANQASISTTQTTTNSNKTGTKSQSKNGKEAASSSRTNVPSSITKAKSKTTSKGAAGDAPSDPKAIREVAPTTRYFKICYDEKYFKKSPNFQLWTPLPLSKFDQNPPQIPVISEKTAQVEELITKESYLSSGAFGDAYLCKVKGLKKYFVLKTLKRIAKDAEDVRAELNVYSNVSSEFIPKLFSATISKSCVYSMVLEYISGGTLEYNYPRIQFEDVAFIGYELSLALDHLHGYNLSHGDLKGDNVALTEDGHVKMFDFGFSRDISRPTKLPKTPYMAPEVRDGHLAGASADYWSYGYLLLYLMQRTGLEIHKKSIVADDFIRKCLEKNPEKRIRKVREHRYLKLKSFQPSFIPGKLIIPEQQRPLNEDNCGIQMGITKSIIQQGLIRFPSVNLYRSFM